MDTNQQGGEMNWFLEVLRKYAVFSGRARRMEYWMFYLFSFIFTIVFGIIDAVVGSFNPETGMGLFGGIYLLAIIIPSIAVLVRRLHDTNRSGWWLLIGLIPIVGAITLLVFSVLDGTPGTNQYGGNPKVAPVLPPT